MNRTSEAWRAIALQLDYIPVCHEGWRWRRCRLSCLV